MIAGNLLKGAKYFSMRYWRWLWFKGTYKNSYQFEDAAGERFILTDDDIMKLSENGWR